MRDLREIRKREGEIGQQQVDLYHKIVQHIEGVEGAKKIPVLTPIREAIAKLEARPFFKKQDELRSLHRDLIDIRLESENDKSMR